MIVAATGHRPDKLGGYGEDVFEKLVQLAMGFLEANKEVTYGISGMALGWDMAYAEALCIKGYPWTAAVPFQGQEKKWPEHSQRKFYRLLDQAHTIEYVSAGGYAPYKMQIRNAWMVDRSDSIVALWNGTSGGTKNCIDYAEKKGKPIINLWDRFSA